MNFSCGIMGLPGVGKTCLYNAITAAGAAAFGGDEANRAVVQVPDGRVAPLVALYKAPKSVYAQMEIVDIPGLARGSSANGGRGGKLLGHLKDADALLHVARCFEYAGLPHASPTIDPVRDVEAIDLEMMVADLQTVQNKIDRLAKRVRVGEAEAKRETDALEKVKTALEQGTPARRQAMDAITRHAAQDCHLASQKPVVYIANIRLPQEADGPHARALAALAERENAPCMAFCARDEAEIAQMDAADQAVFLEELGLRESSIERLTQAAYQALGLVNFLTAGPKEVHVWTCQAGQKAPAAAGKIHTDMEKGFIRMEVIRCADLLELGSEAAVAKAGKARVEGKDYVIQDGDVVVVRFNK